MGIACSCEREGQGTRPWKIGGGQAMVNRKYWLYFIALQMSIFMFNSSCRWLRFYMELPLLSSIYKYITLWLVLAWLHYFLTICCHLPAGDITARIKHGVGVSVKSQPTPLSVWLYHWLYLTRDYFYSRREYPMTYGRGSSFMQRFPNPGLFKKASVRGTICSLPGCSLLRILDKIYCIKNLSDYRSRIHKTSWWQHHTGKHKVSSVQSPIRCW